MAQEKKNSRLSKKNCKYFLIFSIRLKMLFLFNGNIKINNDIKKKIKFDISFYLEETNHKRIFYKFFLGWFNGKKSPAKFVNYEVLNRKNKFHKNFFQN